MSISNYRPTWLTSFLILDIPQSSCAIPIRLTQSPLHALAAHMDSQRAGSHPWLAPGASHNNDAFGAPCPPPPKNFRDRIIWSTLEPVLGGNINFRPRSSRACCGWRLPRDAKPPPERAVVDGPDLDPDLFKGKK